MIGKNTLLRCWKTDQEQQIQKITPVDVDDKKNEPCKKTWIEKKEVG